MQAPYINTNIINDDYTEVSAYEYDSHGWRNKRDEELIAGRYRKDNPYLRQIQFATTKQDYQAARELAVKWEGSRADVEYANEETRNLRDEDREYNDPSSRIARERAAGINSDLSGGTGSSSSGTGTSSSHTGAQASPVSNTVPFASAAATYDRTLNGIRTGLEVVSTIVSVVQGGVNLFKSFKTFGNEVSASTSNAQLLSDAAEVSDVTKPARIAQGISEGWDLTGLLAEGLDGTKQYTDDDLRAYISDYIGEDKDDAQLRKLRRYMSSPSQQDWYNKRKLAALESGAMYNKLPLDFHNKRAETYYKLEERRMVFDDLKSQYDQIFAEAFFTEENAELSASNSSQQLSNLDKSLDLQSDAIDQSKEEFKRYLLQYASALEQMSKEVQRIDAEIAELDKLDKKNPGVWTPEVASYYMGLEADKYLYNQLGANEFASLRRSIMNSRSRYYHYKRNVTFNSDKRDGTPTSASLDPARFKENELLWTSVMWSDVVDNNYGRDDIVQSLINIIPFASYLFGKSFGQSPSTNSPKRVQSVW